MALLIGLLGFAIFLGVRSTRLTLGIPFAMFAFTCAASLAYLYLYFKV